MSGMLLDKFLFESHESEVNQRLLHLLFKQGLTTIPLAFVAGLITACVFYLSTGMLRSFIWMAVLQIAQATRLYYFWGNRRKYPESSILAAQPQGIWQYSIPLCAVAVIWGLAPWVLLPATISTEQEALMCVVMFGMMAGSVPSVAPWRPVIGIWFVPLIFGVVSRFAWQGGMVGWALAVVSLVFGVTMVTFALNQHRMYVEVIRAVLDKEAMNGLLLDQSRRLQALYKERVRFFASANHDLRQPVYALTLLSATLQRDLTGHPLHPIAQRLGQATQAIGQMLNSMLELSRIDAGAVQAFPADVPVHKLFERLHQFFGPTAEANSLGLRFRGGNLWVNTDAELLFRTLSNLVDNALKHTHEGGLLVTAQTRGERIRFSVWDTGMGIDSEHFSHLFDEFYQVDNPQRDRTKGLGIGLAIVKRLAKLLNATVGMKSRLGKGSVFWVDMPKRMQASTDMEKTGNFGLFQSPEKSDQSLGLSHKLAEILVLDDEEANTDALKAWLQPYFSAVHTTTRLSQALDVATQSAGKLSIMLVDFRLADTQDGIEAVRILREAVGHPIPALLMTGDTDPKRVKQALNSGLQVFFKPVMPQQLLRAIVDLLTSKLD